MNKREVGVLFDRIIRFYPAFRMPVEQQAPTLLDWHKVLADVDFNTAVVNLERYVSNPEHKYAPHPGALKKPLRSEVERYHDSLKDSGHLTLQEWGQLEASAVGPSDELRRRVKGFAKRNGA